MTLLVRPEQLRLVGAGPGGCAAEVIEVVFYGPHASVRLSLEDGTALVARVDPNHVPAHGALVGVEVTGVAGVYT